MLLLLLVGFAACGRTVKNDVYTAVYAKADITGLDGSLKGRIGFNHLENVVGIQIVFDLDGGCSQKTYGIYISEYGTTGEKCADVGYHFTTNMNNHGAADAKMRHLGDIGKFKTDVEGKVQRVIKDYEITLSGEHSIIGRAVVITEEPGDDGLGKTSMSKFNGNMGKPVACAIIGYAREQIVLE